MTSLITADAAVAGHVTVLDEMLVLLRILEAPNVGPNSAHRRVDSLCYNGSACIGTKLTGLQK